MPKVSHEKRLPVPSAVAPLPPARNFGSAATKSPTVVAVAAAASGATKSPTALATTAVAPGGGWIREGGRWVWSKAYQNSTEEPAEKPSEPTLTAPEGNLMPITDIKAPAMPATCDDEERDGEARDIDARVGEARDKAYLYCEHC